MLKKKQNPNFWSKDYNGNAFQKAKMLCDCIAFVLPPNFPAYLDLSILDDDSVLCSEKREKIFQINPFYEEYPYSIAQPFLARAQNLLDQPPATKSLSVVDSIRDPRDLGKEEDASYTKR